jgi:hypothetical protein
MSIIRDEKPVRRIMDMINIRKTIICMAVAAAALAAASCQNDDTLAYNNMTMGNIVDGKIVSDQGNTFNVVEQSLSGNYSESKRIMMLCDVLNETEGGKDEYDIRLVSFANVLEKKAVTLEEAQEGDITVQDPIFIDQLWFSGGYINMMIRTHVKHGSNTKHLLNLVYSKNENGEYILNFRHNAYGEVWTKENASNFGLSNGAYVSFPIADIIAEDKAKLTIVWQWYQATGMDYDFNTEKEYTFEYNWERKGFIQNF